MSRTYRLRHLPRVGRSPLKFGDARHSKYKRAEYNAFWEALPDALSWSVKYDAWKMHECDNPMPVGPVWDHPWVGFGTAKVAVKKWYRRLGNRYLRRMTKARLWKMQQTDADDWTGVFPLKQEGFSSWDLY